MFHQFSKAPHHLFHHRHENRSDLEQQKVADINKGILALVCVEKEDTQEDLFGSVLKTIEDIEANQPEDDVKGEEVDFSDIEDMLEGSEDFEYKPGLPLSISERDAIKSQIMQNWSTTSFSGAKDVHKMTATLIITLDIDGNVKGIERKDRFRYKNDTIYRALVDSAERAVRKSVGCISV